MRGSCSPESMSTTRVPPMRVFMRTKPGWSSVTAPMIAAFSPKRMCLHGGENGVGIFRRDDGQELPFIGDVERVEPKDFAGAFDLFADRDLGFVKANADAGALRDFAQGAGDAAAGRVAQNVDVRGGGKHGVHQTVQRGGVAADLGFELESLAHRHDGDPVNRNFAADDDFVSGPGAPGMDVHAFGHHADPGGINKNLVGFSAIHHFGIAGDQGDAGRCGRLAHRQDDAPRNPPSAGLPPE